MSESGKRVDPGQAARGTADDQPMSRPGSVSVEIYDQVYHLRGVDPDHIRTLTKIVDEKMRAVSAHGSTVDSLRVAVLAALNIADELVVLRERHDEIEQHDEGERDAHEQLLRSNEQMRQSHEALRQSHEQLRQSHEALRQSYNQLAGSISKTQTSMRSRSASLSGMLDELLNADPVPRRVS